MHYNFVKKLNVDILKIGILRTDKNLVKFML
jgi:hypothetical protein